MPMATARNTNDSVVQLPTADSAAEEMKFPTTLPSTVL